MGGISGPLYFGGLIDSASAAKDITGIAPGTSSVQETLENIARPLTAEDDDAPEPSQGRTPQHA